jgi:hypothetical protein
MAIIGIDPGTSNSAPVLRGVVSSLEVLRAAGVG